MPKDLISISVDLTTLQVGSSEVNQFFLVEENVFHLGVRHLEVNFNLKGTYEKRSITKLIFNHDLLN